MKKHKKIQKGGIIHKSLWMLWVTLLDVRQLDVIITTYFIHSRYVDTKVTYQSARKRRGQCGNEMVAGVSGSCSLAFLFFLNSPGAAFFNALQDTAPLQVRVDKSKGHNLNIQLQS
jgi:hypothetical protein